MFPKINFQVLVRVMFYMSAEFMETAFRGQQLYLTASATTLCVYFSGDASDQDLVRQIVNDTQGKRIVIDVNIIETKPDGTTNLTLLEETLKQYGIRNYQIRE